MTNTDGRVWLITGCSSGFGRELALAALAAGDRVLATARRPETLDELVGHGAGRLRAAAL
ncbi:MAG TPA: SDR family NAD(P)-dependent oxidoreductase, partial [Amycolatopsis sp.]